MRYNGKSNKCDLLSLKIYRLVAVAGHSQKYLLERLSWVSVESVENGLEWGEVGEKAKSRESCPLVDKFPTANRGPRAH